MEITFIALYTIVVILIGYLGKSVKGDDDFVIGKRNIGQVRSITAIFAILVSESSIFFAVALTAQYGALGCFAAFMGPVSGLLIMSFLASNARTKASVENYTSIVDFCYHNWGKIFGQGARIIFLILLWWIIILQLRLNGILLAGILDWSPVLSTVFSVVVVIIYTLGGGYRSVIRTDLFQSILLMIFLILPIFISPRPNLKSGFESSTFSGSVLFLFLMSLAMTITRPEIWQRIYSSASGKIAVRSLRLVSILYAVVGIFLLYYALSITNALPGISANEAFARGYKLILPKFFAALFPVMLMAGMMSNIDSAAFLLSTNLSGINKKLLNNRILWTRVFFISILIGNGIISLTIFNALSFAFKINGLVALMSIPILLSFWLNISRFLLGFSLASGFTFYVVQIILGRIDVNPAEAIIPAIVTGLIMIAGYYIPAVPGNNRSKNKSNLLGESNAK